MTRFVSIYIFLRNAVLRVLSLPVSILYVIWEFLHPPFFCRILKAPLKKVAVINPHGESRA